MVESPKEPASMASRFPPGVLHDQAFTRYASAEKMEHTVEKVKTYLSNHPALTLVAGITMGGLVGWLTSRIR